MVEKDLGFVIRRHNFRETSLIASIYTSRFGKITGILKGFYTQKKEFSSTLSIGSLNEFIFYPKKREIWLISFADLIKDYHFLRTNIDKAKVSMLFVELVERTMQLWDRNSAVFDLLCECLWGLENEQKVLHIFLIKFLTLSGFKPQLDHCIVCHQELKGDVYFSVSKGGLVCLNCKRSAHDLRKISRETLASFLYIQNNDFSKVYRLNPTVACEEEIAYILKEFIRYHLDFDIDRL
jgi:DNA repair protein RecO (recombination protein O)